MRRAERERTFRFYLKEQKPLGEIAQRMRLSDYRLNQLLRTASAEDWPELREHHPPYEIHRSSDFPSTMISRLASLSGLPAHECRFVKIKEFGESKTIRGLRSLPSDK